MALNFIARLRTLGNSAGRLAVALTIAFIATGTFASFAYWAYTYSERKEAQSAEIVRQWSSDLSNNLGITLNVKTKLIDGVMHIAVDLYGYPPYLNYATNKTRGFHFKWNDTDGFTRVKKFVQLSDFTTSVNNMGQPSGLKAQFTEFTPLGDYVKLSEMQVEWNVETEAPKPSPQSTVALPIVENTAADHCAPDLSRQERMRRLSKLGQIRETGLNEFTVNNHSITFLSASEVLSCR